MIRTDAALFILCLGIISSGCKGEEVQTTDSEGDELNSFLEDILSESEPQYLPVTKDTHPDLEERGKRHTGSDEEYMLFANRLFLVQMHLNTTIHNVFQLSEGSNAIACDYDIREGLMFWSDVSNRIIARARLDGTDFTVLLNNSVNITHPDGIAWDWITKKLYWTDTAERDIEVLDPATGNRKVLITNEVGSNLRAIVLDPTTRMMYWTDWGDSPKIEKASMDGSARSVVIDTELGWPNGLTLDYVSQTLYWVDALLDNMEKSNVDGSMRTPLTTPTNVIQHPFGITFFKGHLYWSDWETNCIFTAPVTNTATGTTNFFCGLRYDPMQLHIVDECRQPFVPNPCEPDNGGCSHLCLLSSRCFRGYTCACNDNMVLDMDGRTCIETTQATCIPSCHNGGQCVNGRCICPDGWEGDQCSSPSVEFVQVVYTVMEDAGSVQVCVVKRGEITTEKLQLTLYTEDDTAHAARDYNHVEVDAEISEKVCIDIPVIDNFLPGDTIQFTVTVTANSSCHKIATASVIIKDDEIPKGCTYEVLNSSVLEDETRNEVVVEIAKVLGSIGISNITAVFSTPGGILTDQSTGNETNIEPLKTVYKAITKVLEVERAEEGYDNFVEAVSQITDAKVAACEDGASVSEDDVPRLVRKYMALKEDVVENISEMRSIFGKMLCLNQRDHEERKRKRRDSHCPEREDCECPDSGELTCICEFFACLDPDDDIKPIMGLIDVNVKFGFPCLAFVVDTTGSMGREINAVKEVIRGLLSSEEDGPGCYVLQPFNDYEDGFFHPDSIPDATVVATYNGATSITDLELFLSASENMYAHNGGDGPERQLRALIKTLNVKDSLNIPVMIPGSEIVLLTDASSHDVDLVTDVISKARNQKVCISFYLSESARRWAVYQRIANKTGGTIVNSIDRDAFREFSRVHDYGKCARFYNLRVFSGRKKRQASVFSGLKKHEVPSFCNIGQRCHYFSTSLFTTTVFVIGHTIQDSMIVTKPNEEDIQVFGNHKGEKIYHDPDPLSGQWRVCVETGTLTITLKNTERISTVLQYIRPIVNSTELSLKHTPPPACTEGTLTMETTKIANIGTASVQLLENESGTVLTTVPLYRCANRLLGNIAFPGAIVKYRAVGNDVDGRPFIASLSKSATFVPEDEERFRIVIAGENPIEVECDQTIKLVVTVHNLHDLNETHYTFTTKPVTGFLQVFNPTSLVVRPEGSGSVNMIIVQVTVEPGTSHTFTVTVSDGCTSRSATKTVSIQPPATTRSLPADECGCVNGGTCTTRTIRGRVIRRCACPDGFTGLHCETRT